MRGDARPKLTFVGALKPPSARQEALLQQVLLAGSVDRVGRLLPKEMWLKGTTLAVIMSVVSMPILCFRKRK